MPDQLNTRGLSCCLCMGRFANGDEVARLDCRFNHLMCFECMGLYISYVEDQEDGEFNCPVCGVEVDYTPYVAINLYTGTGTKGDPIIIEDSDSDSSQ